MAGVNFLGSYSGIDQSTIDQMMAVEKRPLIQMSAKKTNIEEQKNAWNDVRTRLNSLFEKIKALQSSDIYAAKTVSKGEGASLTVSKNTNSGSYNISVQQLATKTSTVGGVITAAEGKSEGKFSINGKAEIEVKTNDTIKTIADKINVGKKESGVEATIIDNRLVLTNLETGNTDIVLKNIDADGNETILKEIGLDINATDVSAKAKVIAGEDALFSVNGVEVQRKSNSVNDVIQYTTINLTKKHSEGQSDTLVVTEDTSKIKTALKDLVDQYNSTMTFIGDKLKAGKPEEAGSRGSLAADSSLMRLQSTLRTMITSSISNENSTVKDMSQLGITTVDKFGQLQFSEKDFMETYEKDPAQVQSFFSSTGTDGKEKGFVSRINTYIDSFSSSTGMIKSKTDGFERSLKAIAKQVDNFNDRMERKEKYYITMFSRLDTIMMQAESQMSWLDSQMSALYPKK